jgi:hypothetical protein
VIVLNTPYRLGSTAYAWPDSILLNVRQLGPLVDDVELVPFEDSFPSRSSVAEIVKGTLRLARLIRGCDPIAGRGPAQNGRRGSGNEQG